MNERFAEYLRILDIAADSARHNAAQAAGTPEELIAVDPNLRKAKDGAYILLSYGDGVTPVASASAPEWLALGAKLTPYKKGLVGYNYSLKVSLKSGIVSAQFYEDGTSFIGFGMISGGTFVELSSTELAEEFNNHPLAQDWRFVERPTSARQLSILDAYQKVRGEWMASHPVV